MHQQRTRDIVLIAEFAALIAVSSIFAIPIGPVPITLQNVTLAIAGLCLGPKRGMLAVTLFILAGCIGLPVFNGGKAGLGVLFGPTGGYLIGFICMTGICGMVRRDSSLQACVFWLIIGLACTHVLGIIGLTITLDRTLIQAALIDAVFLPGDILKVIITALIWQFFIRRKAQ